MRRLLVLYGLIFAVLAAAGGLAYYGYTYSRQLNVRERLVIIDTMRELAEEKVIGIESEIVKSDKTLFDRVDIDNLLDFQQVLVSERLAVEAVLILDERKRIVPGGFFLGAVQGDKRFKTMFERDVLPNLGLDETRINERRHLHRVLAGRPQLYSWTRRWSGGRTFYVVAAADLSYLIGTVFPQFFGLRSPRMYQVVDESGQVVYGFERLPERTVVELPFPATVSGWRLRVAQRDDGSLADRGKRQAVDLVLIGSALAIIVVGLSVLLMAVRRERRANELKSDFISNVSHELKTPLSIISMFGEMLASGRTRSPEQATEYAEIIWRESVRLSRLIDNVLDFAKIEKGADPFELVSGDLGEVVERAAELSRHRLERAEMTMSVDIEPGLPMLQIDSNALTLATLNLVDNAIKYAADGEKLEISVRRDNKRVLLEVLDFGPGVAQAEQKAIFERFYRARSVRLQPIRGSGIGLALVKHIAVAHGGDIELLSTEGGESEDSATGCRFRLWIPVPAEG